MEQNREYRNSPRHISEIDFQQLCCQFKEENEAFSTNAGSAEYLNFFKKMCINPYPAPYTKIQLYKNHSLFSKWCCNNPHAER